MKRFIAVCAFVVLIIAVSLAASHIATRSQPVSALSLPPLPLPPTSCTAGDQDKYVFDAERLVVVRSCVHVVGTIVEKKITPAGDAWMLLRLDEGQGNFLNERNRVATKGCLVVEAICVAEQSEAPAAAACAGNATKLKDLPSIGEHIVVEGRLVLDAFNDRDHGWMELHPLHRWHQLEA